MIISKICFSFHRNIKFILGKDNFKVSPQILTLILLINLKKISYHTNRPLPIRDGHIL